MPHRVVWSRRAVEVLPTLRESRSAPPQNAKTGRSGDTRGGAASMVKEWASPPPSGWGGPPALIRPLLVLFPQSDSSPGGSVGRGRAEVK